jgi:hypothetical protein
MFPPRCLFFCAKTGSRRMQHEQSLRMDIPQREICGTWRRPSGRRRRRLLDLGHETRTEQQAGIIDARTASG